MIIKWPRRLLIDKLKRREKLIYPPTTTPSVIRLTSHAMLKKGSHNLFKEAEVMRFIRACTSIPLPDVLDTWLVNEDYAYLSWKESKACLFAMYSQSYHLHRREPSLMS